jgi:hypothetical protein
MKPVSVYREEGIRLAHEAALREKNLEAGQMIGIIGDDIAHRLEYIIGNTAVVFHGREHTTMEIPLDQLYDPKEAFRIALILQATDAHSEKENFKAN